jgi:uncharacterized ferritin-like protein (DUF455 family)
MRQGSGGHGDIVLALKGPDHIAWLHLWPHARPWHLTRTQPMLRALPQVADVAALLQSLGHDYGDFQAHDGLWSMAEKTAEDIVARMALVPRTLEARGLDATPPMQARLARAGDHRAVEILGVILHDEVQHVAIGNRWYRWLCEEHGLDPQAHYPVLAQRYGAPRLKGPFNLEARSRAGFTDEELSTLPTD